MPRETLTAPLILPLACTSDGSRTSTISAFPRSINARASAGSTRGTAVFAAASISLTLDGMIDLHLEGWHRFQLLTAEACRTATKLLAPFRGTSARSVR